MRKEIGKIGVLSGGPSSEREISIKSGAAVYDGLISLGLDVVCIDPKDASSVKEDILKAEIEIAFIALHGRFGEDGTVQAILEDIGIPYTGSGPEASRLALNKISSRRIFHENGIPVPKWKACSRSSKPEALLKEFPFPFVVKPCNEGSSIGLSIVEAKEEAAPAIDMALSYDDQIIIEEYIPGEDITVGILDEEPLPVVHIKPKAKFYSFHAKYTQGMSEYIVPARFPKDIIEKAQALGVSAHGILGCRAFSRVDMLLDKRDNNVVVLEVNTIPGLTFSSLLPKAAAAVGIDFPQMCLRMVKSALVSV